ncbi:Mitotic check point protein BFA1 [Nakaseomyces glabratus]|uniref:Mitotic check point protein BFA1 n=1 Tax=Candida glabrata TaxID=5478 RepID=A0A0W0CMS3_CANGB|nr:hypothetical protein J7298_00930 [Nakaseomyces glabratus]KAH7590728.1 hypothetical protein J7297_00931 [Nakaseomyces glabratus]KAH7596760.1 hypothetical protein J7296_00930 [Nakaseomyces glabratus]KAH7606616.1 hypothetical protein J7295_00933 [Nakaseomyces glabratus]KAH7614758.1 hypothetical protein J7292_00909 [Nakaseomyces glabratus]
MSIRPANMMDYDLPETSFEDIDATFSRDVPTSSVRNTLDMQQSMPVEDRKVLQEIVQPTPSSITTSDTGTIFSGSRKQSWLNNLASDEDKSDGFEDGEEFLSDFQEFQNRKDDFDEAIKSHFNLQKRSSRGDYDLATDFERKVNINPNSQRRSLRQPRSMMDMHPLRSENSFNPHRLQNSISTNNLHRPNRLGSLHFKKSMPSLSSYNPVIEEEPRYWKKSWDIEEAEEDDDYFDEDFDEDGQETFDLDEKTLKNRVQSNIPTSKTPFKISPTQFDIIQQDDLLTPRLHKKQKELRYKHNLEAFKETSKARRRRHTAKSKIQTIKQQIDHNTPMKSGLMYYNPKKMAWEGNERVLDKFQDIISIDKRPLLIKNKSNISPNETLTYTGSDNNNVQDNGSNSTFSSTTNPRVVGKMMFDERNLRWVSVNNDEIDPFAEIEENIPEPILGKPKRSSPFLRSRSQLISSNNPEVSFTESDVPGNDKFAIGVKKRDRYASTSAAISKRAGDRADMERVYRLSSKELERLYHEENRWQRKVGGWFVLGDGDQQDRTMAQYDPSDKGNNFMYEIRKMVINSTKN